MMRKLFVWLLVGLLALVPSVAQAQLGSVTYTFTSGTTIRSSEVNAMFTYIYANAVLRSGGVLTGTLTTLALLPTTDNASDIGSAALSYNDGWFDGTLTVATLVPTTFTCTGCVGATALANLSSADLAGKLTDESGTGVVAFTVSPTFTTPTLGAATATTVDTGQGANELYDMDQNVLTSSSPSFAGLDLTATGLAWGDVNKTGSSLADLATRAVANLSDGSNVALLNAANGFTANQTVTVSGMSAGVKIAQVSDATTYGTFSLNGVVTSTGLSGLFGRASGGDIGNLYVNVPTGSQILLTINASTLFGVRAAGWYQGSSLMDSVGTPSCTSGCTFEAGKDYAFWISGLTTSVDAVVTFGNTWTNVPICTATVRPSAGISLDRYSIRATTTAVYVGTGDATPDPVNVICRGY